MLEINIITLLNFSIITLRLTQTIPYLVDQLVTIRIYPHTLVTDVNFSCLNLLYNDA